VLRISNIFSVDVNEPTGIYKTRSGREICYLAYNFVTKNLGSSDISRDLKPIAYRAFLVIKRNLGGHTLKEDRKLVAVVTRLLTTKDRGCCQQGAQSFVPRYDKFVSCF
jgi:hypothetical protein